MHPQAPAEVRLGLAACHFAMKDFASARLAFARAADMDNECVDAYVGLAKCDLAEFEGGRDGRTDAGSGKVCE